MRPLLSFVESYAHPTDDQDKAVQALETFFQSDDRCFLLKGYAGTGKTFLSLGLVKYIIENKWEPVLLAPTGRAARILSEKTSCNACTIHKGIYNLDDIDEIEVFSKDKVSYKFIYKLNHIETSINRVYIIDEASMISDVISEGDFFVFGSGKLLSDLMEFVALNNQGRNDKIIFIGDNAQLSPVSDTFSGALSATYLQKNFQVKVDEYELTEVVRQQSGNGILEVATYLRDLLRNPSRNSFKLPSLSSDIIEIRMDTVIDQFIDNISGNDLGSSVIINYSNKSAFEFNMQLRHRLFPGLPGLNVDEILLINQNNYNYDPPLLNGMFVKVISADAVPEIRSGLKSYDQQGKECLITHKFRKIVIEVHTGNAVECIPCFILENFLFNPNPSLDYAENIALYIDFKMRHPHLKARTREFRDTLRQDPYFNSLRVKFGYAVTCHKAQGGEWEKAIVNLDVSQGKLSDMFIRWTYTAITRASKQVFLFNVPSAGQFSKLIYQQDYLAEKSVKSPVLIISRDFYLPEKFSEMKSQFGFVDHKQFLIDKFVELLARLDGTNIRINNIDHSQYQEIYQFSNEGQTAGIGFFYDGKERFGKVALIPRLTTDEALYLEIISMVTSPFSFRLMNTSDLKSDISETASIVVNDFVSFFDSNNKHLEPLHKELGSLLNPVGIDINDIIHKSYQERYYFTKESEKACIDFWYDQVGRFTYAKPFLADCNSNSLLDNIEYFIEILKTC
jgi:hypothetical protein